MIFSQNKYIPSISNNYIVKSKELHDEKHIMYNKLF